MLDAVLRSNSDWEGCAVCCCHCGIRFLTHPRNAGRQDLRCPFGCRTHHRRQQANARSRKYNQTPHGRANKKQLNTAARLQAAQAESPDSVPTISVELTSQRLVGLSVGHVAEAATLEDSPAVDQSPAIQEQLTLPLDGFVLDEPTLINSPVLPYVRMVMSVLERRPIGREELLQRLRRSLRQRSIGRLSRREYALRYLHEHPP